MPPKITVLGAGVSGLSSAVCIQQACPLAQVQLVAEHFSPDTTSDGSAGYWEPYLLGEGGRDISMKACKVTYRYMMDLANSSLASVVKVQKLAGYHLFKNIPLVEHFWKDVVDGYRVLTEREMKQFPTADAGTYNVAVTVDVASYMDWLMKRFKAQGGITRQTRVESIEEIASECDILINCSATSSKFLFKDDSIYPARGQVWKVRAPWIKHFYVLTEKGKEASYILPGVDYVTVGGTAQVGDWNTQPDPVDAASIWERAVSHFPFLKGATPLKSWAGLRPMRESIRLEPETITVHGRKVKVVHNYGHGGSGVTMHWGCAIEVTKMVLEALGTEPQDVERVISRL